MREAAAVRLSNLETMSYVLGVDVGTTKICCLVLNKDGEKVVSHTADVVVLHPQPGHSEIQPDELWERLKQALVETLRKGGLEAKDAVCLGITCQRNSFLLWNRETGAPLCNLITWQDRRAADVCREWNESMQFKFLHAGAGFLHAITRNKRFLGASILSLQCQMVAPRLYWALKHVEGASQLAQEGKLCFGTTDSWVLWKLTGGTVHATDYSNVCTSALYDPYQMQWSSTILNLLGIPTSILPKVKDSGGLFGTTPKDLFGAAIPITGVISDQTSAMFAQGCWERGDLKCSMGTGMFMCLNTGRKPHTSLQGLYPVIGWKIGSEVAYLAEANFPSCGSVVEWGKRFGLFSDPAETEALAEAAEKIDGLCFLPAFDGIQAPITDPHASAGVLGMTHNTQSKHVVRAMLESLAYSFKMLFDTACSEVEFKVKRVCVDGGVSKNGFVVQLSSTLLGHPIERPAETDMTVCGAIFLAGLASGFWTSKDQILSFRKLDRKFEPMTGEERKTVIGGYRRWQQAIDRSLHWYKEKGIPS